MAKKWFRAEPPSPAAANGHWGWTSRDPCAILTGAPLHREALRSRPEAGALSPARPGAMAPAGITHLRRLSSTEDAGVAIHESLSGFLCGCG